MAVARMMDLERDAQVRIWAGQEESVVLSGLLCVVVVTVVLSAVHVWRKVA